MTRAASIGAPPVRLKRRHDAAQYVGVGATKFDEWVREGMMPEPYRIDGMVLWDVRELDAAIDALLAPAMPVREIGSTRAREIAAKRYGAEK